MSKIKGWQGYVLYPSGGSLYSLKIRMKEEKAQEDALQIASELGDTRIYQHGAREVEIEFPLSKKQIKMLLKLLERIE